MNPQTLQWQGEKLTEKGETLMPWTCPECSGPVWVTNEPVLQLRCRIGHAYSPQSFLEEQEHAVENLMWTLIRLLQDRSAFQQFLASDAHSHGDLLLERQHLQATARSEQCRAAVESLLTCFLSEAEAPE